MLDEGLNKKNLIFLSRGDNCQKCIFSCDIQFSTEMSFNILCGDYKNLWIVYEAAQKSSNTLQPMASNC